MPSNKGLIGGMKCASAKNQIEVHFVPPPQKVHFVPGFQLVCFKKAQNQPTWLPCSSPFLKIGPRNFNRMYLGPLSTDWLLSNGSTY